MNYSIPTLPLKNYRETANVLKKAIAANKAIAELKAVAYTIPNQTILINTLSLQESKDSSEVEGIVTTHDEIFQYDKKKSGFSLSNKEVHRYNEALFHGFKTIRTKPITNNLLIEISQVITGRNSGLRNVPGTTLKNLHGEIIYTPPQEHEQILQHMKNLERFINDSEISDFDPLVKMAIIHHQFESIHPFFDGNGRTGRILNILYLVFTGILDIPILYLSRYITQNKQQYYNLLQSVRDEENWEQWILFMLEALESTAKQTITTIQSIKNLMMEYKKTLRQKAPKIYSHELLNNIFSHPYTKIEFMVHNAKISRVTASKHLKKLVEMGLLHLEKHKNTNYYINTRLLSIFTSLSEQKG